MRSLPSQCSFLIMAAVLAAPLAADQETISGETLDPSTHGAGVVETWGDVEARMKAAPPLPASSSAEENRGEWLVPSLGATGLTSSGTHYVINKFGDPRMGISFPMLVDVDGAFFHGQADPSVWAEGVQVVGYRDGVEVARSEWLFELSEQPQWLRMEFEAVDRILIHACPKVNGAGWYGMDDLTYSEHRTDGQPAGTLVVDFDDLSYKKSLAGSDYAGLTWELGSGDFSAGRGIHAPINPLEGQEEDAGAFETSGVERGGSGTAPGLLRSFRAVHRGDASQFSFPPDTHGAVGPNHYVSVVNNVYAVYNKLSGATQQISSLGTFLPGSSGDPRVIYDHHSGRWIVIASNFSNRLYLAVSQTSDPTGAWFKTNILVSQGSDASAWPDYPTLGVDANGIYTSAFMVGASMSIFVIDKAPLIGSPQSLGTVTAFRSLPFEGALQPAYTYGNPPGEYYISRTSSTSLRVRRINPPMSAPTLTQVGFVTTPSTSTAPDAPALGSTTPLDTIDTRLMNAVFRNGSLWCAHTVNVNNRAAIRWYEIDPALLIRRQTGVIDDPVRYYFFPGIMVNDAGHVVVGFTGSSANERASAYFTGRLPSDPLGEMGVPVLYKAGTAAYNVIDGQGRNRWGDYSYTSVDPVDDMTFYTNQEYVSANNTWGNWVAVVTFADCNGNGILDSIDILNGTSLDCDLNGIPDECDPDCDNDNIPDSCEIAGGAPDCNQNGVPDACDIALGGSQDCNSNGIPDECETPDCNGNGRPDGCDIALGSSLDCNTNGVPDECEGNDCNQNGVPDDCDIAVSTSEDCNNNGIPDECDLSGEFTTFSGDLSPIGTGVPQQFTIPSAPEAVGNVTMQFTGNGDFNFTSEFVTVDVNGTIIGNIFVSGFSDCANVNDQIVVDEATWNGSLTGPDAVITMTASSAVDPNSCTPASFISVAVTYNGIGVSGSEDKNMNGIPDECEGLLSPGDMNCDGIVTPGDIAGFVLALTNPAEYAVQFPNCNILNGDINGDGLVTPGDIAPFVALLTGP